VTQPQRTKEQEGKHNLSSSSKQTKWLAVDVEGCSVDFHSFGIISQSKIPPKIKAMVYCSGFNSGRIVSSLQLHSDCSRDDDGLWVHGKQAWNR